MNLPPVLTLVWLSGLVALQLVICLALVLIRRDQARIDRERELTMKRLLKAIRAERKALRAIRGERVKPRSEEGRPTLH